MASATGTPAVLALHRLLGFIPTEAVQHFSPQLNPMYVFDAEDVKTMFETFDRTLDVFKIIQRWVLRSRTSKHRRCFISMTAA